MLCYFSLKRSFAAERKTSYCLIGLKHGHTLTCGLKSYSFWLFSAFSFHIKVCAIKKKRTRIINDNKCCKPDIQNNRIYLNGAKIGLTFSNISSTVPTALICTNKLANLLFRQFISRTRKKWKAISSPRI